MGGHVGSGLGAARAGGPAVPPGCGRPGAAGEGCAVSQHLLGSDVVLTWVFFNCLDVPHLHNPHNAAQQDFCSELINR